MDIDENIPSYLWLQGQKAYVYYPGQLKTCAYCNKVGHIVANCPNKTNRRGWETRGIVENSNKIVESSIKRGREKKLKTLREGQWE